MARPIKNLVGQKFGWLEVIRLDDNQIKGDSAIWVCKCDCGKVLKKKAKYLSKNTLSSCGCKIKESNLSHTKPWNNRLRNCFHSAKNRCTNTKHKNYKHYRAKGITFLIKDYEELYNCLGNPNNNQTLDRIDSTKNYSLDNIRWATLKEQQRNRHDNKWYTYQGKKYIAKDLFDLLSPNCSYDCFRARLKRGWSIDKACL